MKKFVVCRMCIDDLIFLGHYKNRPLKLSVSSQEYPESTCKQEPRCFDQPERLKNRDTEKDVGL
jgi:hypothetical protein